MGINAACSERKKRRDEISYSLITLEVLCPLSHAVFEALSPALDEYYVVAELTLDQSGRDWLFHRRWLEGKCSLLKWTDHGSSYHPSEISTCFRLVFRIFLRDLVESLPCLDLFHRLEGFGLLRISITNAKSTTAPFHIIYALF